MTKFFRQPRRIARQRRSTAGAVISELARQALIGSGSRAAGVEEPEAFCGFRPLPAGDRLVSDETVERLRDAEGV